MKTHMQLIHKHDLKSKFRQDLSRSMILPFYNFDTSTDHITRNVIKPKYFRQEPHVKSQE